ncbi:hypothetical protein E2C01_086018 [Portunus trituberculatus]|uniref:Uncharacterized protein n=1 Tax=Portunus trituberculatus TaxID=210409 RepID=A0A5B7J2N4_PORTR|nr:hypothetical protein [Portunus trituberculatus]
MNPSGGDDDDDKEEEEEKTLGLITLQAESLSYVMHECVPSLASPGFRVTRPGTNARTDLWEC